MAMASGIEPSEETSFFSKWMLLLIEGGTLVLRDIFDKSHPPQYLGHHLSQPPIRAQLNILFSKRIITTPQRELLYPQQGSPVSSSFDVGLLVCLLRHICGLKTHSPVWTSSPSSTDFSIEADISRLRLLRNECAHTSQASMTQSTFNAKWAELEQVLLRLGSCLPGLKTRIQSLQTKSIDPMREEELTKEIEEWKKFDAYIESEIVTVKHRTSIVEKQLSVLFAQNLGQHRNIRHLKRQSVGHKKNISQLNTTFKLTKRRQKEIQTLFKESMLPHLSMAKEIIQAKELQQVKKAVSPELEALASSTALYIDDALSDKSYIETSFHQMSKDVLMKQNILVITGNPGEGKTTMALRVMSEISPTERCLRLREPSDWKLVDVGMEHYEVVLIDDIFGAGVLDDRLVREWNKFLPDIEKASHTRSLKFIITSRQYVLDDAKPMLRQTQLFDDVCIVTLSSKKLSEVEKTNMLQGHLEKHKRLFQHNELINECIKMSAEYFKSNAGPELRENAFGFPQCANLFASNENFLKRKASFFSRPREMFKTYIEELYKDEAKFLPLILLWSRPNQRLLISELGMTSISHELKRIAKKFGVSLKPKVVKAVRKSLERHQTGFVLFNSRDGSYTFSHQTIADMIGIVVSKTFPEAIIEASSREFILSHVTLSTAKNDEHHFYIEEYLYRKLGERLLFLLQNPISPFSESVFKRFRRRGHCPNEITAGSHLDYGIIFCDAFKKPRFIDVFVEMLEDKKTHNVAEKVLTLPVMNMSGHFLGRGINIEDSVITLPDYLLLHGRKLLLECLLKRNTAQKLGLARQNLEMSMLIGVHLGKTDLVRLLLENGADVTEEAIYTAAMAENTDLLPILVKHGHRKVGQKSKILNGNNALTASAKKGLTSVVKCLVENGEDLAFRNADGLSALDKAVIYKRIDICKILIEAGSPLNTQAGKHKRTALHIACDVGLPDVVQLLLKYGASPHLRDSKGHYPIHCAAFQNKDNADRWDDLKAGHDAGAPPHQKHVRVVKVLLEYDLSLAKQRIFSYKKRSQVKGMTVFHIAIMNESYELLRILIESKADANVTDYFGRTPYFYGIFTGKSNVWRLRNVTDLNKAEKQGLTPLHAALIRHNKSSYQYLSYSYKEVVNFNAADKWGRTPLHIAFSHGLIDMGLMMILECNADMRMVTKDGTSIFHILKKKAKHRKSFTLDRMIDKLMKLYPQIEIQENGEISYQSLLTLMKLIDPGYAQYTGDLQL